MGDGPEANGLAIASRALGLVAVLLILVGTLTPDDLFWYRCPPAPLIGVTAIIAGVRVNRHIRKSAGRQRGSKIAWAAIILGVISFPLFIAGLAYLNAVSCVFC